jgi:hypothetical protein
MLLGGWEFREETQYKIVNSKIMELRRMSAIPLAGIKLSKLWVFVKLG